MFDVKQCSFICLFYFGVIWDRRINVSFTPLCRLKWKSPCNQNSLNVLWMLSTDFCAWVHTWLGIRVGALGSPSLAGKTCQLQIVFAMWCVQFSRSLMSDSLQPHGLQHASAHCSSPNPGAWANSRPSSWWFHQTISSSVLLFSCCLQSFSETGSFLMSQFFTSVGQSVGGSISASVLPMNIQGWFPLGLTGLILQVQHSACHSYKC